MRASTEVFFCYFGFNQTTGMLPQRIFHIPVRFISKSFIRDKIGPMGGLSKKKSQELKSLDQVELSVETDAKRLVNYVCGTNILEEGGEDVKIKADSEYPKWLKEIGIPIPFEKMDPNTTAYWRKLRKIKQKESNYLKLITRTGTVHK